jgi:hypothetical protein
MLNANAIKHVSFPPEGKHNQMILESGGGMLPLRNIHRPIIYFKNLRDICVFPSNSANQYKDYTLVMVETNYYIRF